MLKIHGNHNKKSLRILKMSILSIILLSFMTTIEEVNAKNNEKSYENLIK